MDINPPSFIISIHALLAESDLSQTIPASSIIISIHALLAESDGLSRGIIPNEHKFLSTLSLRRATRLSCFSDFRYRYFYPRSPCGERPMRKKIIYILIYFYPRSPCGERLPEERELSSTKYISIHALLAESDIFREGVQWPKLHFYPRSPCGERP